MAKKNPERQRLVDQAAQSAHDVVTQLHARAAQVEDELRQTASMVVGGAEEGTTVQLNDIEGTVRNVMNYVEENPFAAAAMALGAGALLTSMYWDQFAALRGKSKAPARASLPRAAAPKATKKKSKARSKAKSKAKAPRPGQRSKRARNNPLPDRNGPGVADDGQLRFRTRDQRAAG